MKVPAFLARRELRVRWGRAVLASAVVAGAVALSVGLELLGRSRERAVEAQLDAAGPAIRILPAGVSAADALALRVRGTLPAGIDATARDALGGSLRRIEGRTLLRDGDTGAAVVAVDDASAGPPGLSRGRVVLGAGVAERWSARADGVVRVLGRSFTIGAIAETRGDANDYAVHVVAEDVGVAAPNELSVFLEPGVASRDAHRVLEAALPNASVTRNDRGEVADGGLQGSVAAHRRAVQLVTALVAALALLIATHLDTAERHRELALLAAIGFSRRGLASLVVLRSVASALAGGLAGIAVAVGLAASRPGFLAAPVPAIAAGALLAAAALASVAALPSAIVAAARDPVRELQDG